VVIGQVVSHYRIIEKLGEGGMGVVFKAEDLKLDRFVALKFLPRQLSADGETKARFIHEAKSASSLDHPNICAIHEIGETADGQTFIVMPCYDGETLKERIKKGQVGIDEAIGIAMQVASGLAKAHERGIVHRDVKPGNILLTKDGQVKLVDFGVAKLAGQTTLTKTGARVGTVGYMSPEQVLGETLDARSDVFSLGVVMYELLTGRLPFRGEHEAAMLYSIIHEEPQPVSKHRTDVPDLLEEIIERSLAKDVEIRYANAGEVARELEAVRADLTAGRPLPTRGRRRRRAKRAPSGRRGMVLVSAVVAVVAALLAVRFFWWPSMFEPSEALAVVDFRDLAGDGDPTPSAGMTNLVHVGLVESSPVRVISPELLHDLRRRLFERARGPIDADQALEVARQAEASLLLSGQIGTIEGAPYVTWQLVEVATGKSLAARRVSGDNPGRIADQIIGDLLPLLSDRSGVEAPAAPRSVIAMTTTSPEAFKRYTAGILASEEMRWLDASREFRDAIDLDSTFALAYFELSRTYDLNVERELARAYSAIAWSLRNHLGFKDYRRLEVWREMIEGQDAEAIESYREMLGRWPDDREVLNDLLLLLFYKWYYDDVLATVEQALELYPDDVMFGLLHGQSLAFTGRASEALEVTQRYVDGHKSNENAWDELGLRYLGLGMPDTAEVSFRKALAINPEFWHSQRGLAGCHYVRGEVDKAIQALHSVLETGDLSGSDSLALFTDVTFWPGLALLHAEAGRFQKAMAVFEEAIQSVSVPAGPTQVEGRTQVLLRMGRPAEALRLAEELVTDAETPNAKLSAKHYRIRALVALDSLAAARAALSDWLADEKASAPEPFLRLRATTDVALAEGDYKDALRALEEMGRHGVPLGGLHDIERRESLAQAMHAADRTKEAIAVLRDLLRLYGSHTVAHYELGLLYEDIGRDAEARAEYEAFLGAWASADKASHVADARARLQAIKTREP
jgi:tetratricopeptide (TPR) repeat protein